MRALPTWARGVARLLDLGGFFTADVQTPDGATADRVAVALDWELVGQAIGGAISQYAVDGVARSEEAADGSE